MSDTLTIIISAASLAGSVAAMLWARRAIAKAERIRASTESVDRLEMRRIADEAAKRRPAIVMAPATTFDFRKPSTGSVPADAHGWMS